MYMRWGFPNDSMVKESTCKAGDTGDVGEIPESGSSPGGGNGNTAQYSCLESSVDRGAWKATVQSVTVLDTSE